MAKKSEKLVQQIREVRKEKANKVCFDCGEKGPQYVCLPFSTFVCMTCSGLHREFNHRVKSISISDFTEEEVNNIVNGGNEVAQRKWMARYDPKDFPIPDPSQPTVIRTQRLKELIKFKYLDRRWVERDDKKKKKEDKEKKKPKEKDKKPKPTKKEVPKEEEDEEDGPGSPKRTGRSVTLPPMVVRHQSEEDEAPKKVKPKPRPVPTPAVESKSKPKPKKASSDVQPKQHAEVDDAGPRTQTPPSSSPDPLDLLSFSSDEPSVPPTNGTTNNKDGDDWADFDGPQQSSTPVSYPPQRSVQQPSTEQWGGFTSVPVTRPPPTFIDFTVKSSSPSGSERKVEDQPPKSTPIVPTPQSTDDPFAGLLGPPPTTQAPPQLGSTHVQTGTSPTVSSLPVVPSLPTLSTIPTTIPGVPPVQTSPYGVNMMTPGVGVSQWSQQAAYQAAMHQAYQQQMMYYYMAQQHAAAQAAQQSGVSQPTSGPSQPPPSNPPPVQRNSFEDLVFQ